MRRPVAFGALGMVLLIALGAPAVAAEFGAPDDRLLRAGQPVRDMYDTIREDFDAEDADAVYIVAPSATDAEIGRLARDVSLVDGILRVDSPAGSFRDGAVAESAGDDDDRFRDGDAAYLTALPASDRSPTTRATWSPTSVPSTRPFPFSSGATRPNSWIILFTV